MNMATTTAGTVSGYPLQAALRDGVKVTMKPMTPQDGPALVDFFRRMPLADLYYFKDDVLQTSVVLKWASEINFDRTLPLLAWADGKVVADATLHRTRAKARRHVGQLRITVDPHYRQRGLGTMLLRELAKVADKMGVERLVFELVADKELDAIKAAEFVGFVKAGVLPGHAKDPEGHPRDIVVLEMPLGKWFEWWNF